MGVLVFILGKSGTGKSYSLHNFPTDKLAVVNVQGKVLPFKGSGAIKTVDTDDSYNICKEIKNLAAEGFKSIVVDDFQYVMANEFMRRSSERGYDKFTDIGRHAWDIAKVVNEIPRDCILYVLCHTDRDDEGNEKIKTIGKLLDEKICLEGMSTIVLKTGVVDGSYYFYTQNNGKDTTKSPAGMFPTYAIENDLKYVDDKIRNYYQLGEFISDEEAEALDKIKGTDVSKEKAEGKKSSRRAKETEEKPKRRRSVSEELEEEREAVRERNDETIANNSLDKATDETEGVPFDEVDMPELEEPPKRKKREVVEPDDAPVEEAGAEKIEEAAPARRRRRRA